MTRAPFAIALAAATAAAAAGCEREGDDRARPAPRGGERVAAVPATADDRTLDDLCDVIPRGDAAATLEYPSLSDDSARPPEGGWRWINLWATWCKPCVEEIPMLRDWSERLSAGDTELEIVFISVDESAEAIEDFRRDHPDAPADYRVADPETVLAWVADLGLDGGATIPVHVVVDPDGRVRCLRSGKVYPRDEVLVERLLAGER